MFSQFSSAFASSSSPPSTEGPSLIGSEVNMPLARAVLNTRHLQGVLNEALDSLTAVDIDSLDVEFAKITIRTLTENSRSFIVHKLSVDFGT